MDQGETAAAGQLTHSKSESGTSTPRKHVPWLVRVGLLFGEAKTEKEYQETAMYSRVNALVAWWVILLFGGTEIVDDALNSGALTGAPEAAQEFNIAAFVCAAVTGLLFVVSFICFSIAANPCSRGKWGPSHHVYVRIGAWFAMAAFLMFFPRHFILEDYYEVVFKEILLTSTNSSTITRNASVDVQWDQMCTSLNFSDTTTGDRISPFSALSVAARLTGLTSGGNADGLMDILVMWVGIKILVSEV